MIMLLQRACAAEGAVKGAFVLSILQRMAHVSCRGYLFCLYMYPAERMAFAIKSRWYRG